MGFYSFSLLLLFLGRTYGVYLREAAPRDQATQCSGLPETENLSWHTDPDPAIMNDVAHEIPITVTRTCRDRPLLKKRQGKRKGKNIFNTICQREITGKNFKRQRTVDVRVGIGDGIATTVPTPDGGQIQLWAEQELTPYNDYDDREREELQITILNRSACNIWIEWLTSLQLWPEFVYQTPERLEPRALGATPKYYWIRAPHTCDIESLMPIHVATSVGIRLLIEAFGSHA